MISDLHCHTRHSDGFLPTSQLLALAAQAGVRRLAVVDHDTTAGLGEALKLAADYGLEVVPGIEISARDESSGRKAHVLGLFLPEDCAELERFCAPVRRQRREAGDRILDLLQGAGYRIRRVDVERYAPSGWFKNHFQAALRAAGYGKEDPAALDAKLFAEGGAAAPPGLAHVPIRYPRVQEAVAAVRAAGGLPVLAHPGLYDNFDLVEDLLSAGLVGIEAAHPAHSPQLEQRSRELARRHGLKVSGGSDFHGELDDPKHLLGCRGIGEQEYRSLRELTVCSPGSNSFEI